MYKWLSKKRNQKGFTLIELVVVIAILGILAAIAIPRLSGSRDNAQKKAILANLRTIDSAITLAHAETGTLAVDADDLNQLISGQTGSLGDYIASSPNPVAGEVYKIASGRAVVTFSEATLDVDAGTYNVDQLLDDDDWK